MRNKKGQVSEQILHIHCMLCDGDTDKMLSSLTDLIPISHWVRTHCIVLICSVHALTESCHGSLLTFRSEMIFQENSKKCYSFEMRTWLLVHCSILIHGLLATAHLLLKIN